MEAVTLPIIKEVVVMKAADRPRALVSFRQQIRELTREQSSFEWSINRRFEYEMEKYSEHEVALYVYDAPEGTNEFDRKKSLLPFKANSIVDPADTGMTGLRTGKFKTGFVWNAITARSYLGMQEVRADEVGKLMDVTV
jgi:hypothetical protein